MRRALSQPRFEKIEVVDGRIWGIPSKQTYDPFDRFEQGMAPHLAFANAKDPWEWHKTYGPLFGFTSAYSSSANAFLAAQRRFVSVLNLWQVWGGDRHQDIRECFCRAVAETGCLALPEKPGKPGKSVYGLNPDWNAETRGETLDENAERPIDNSHCAAAEEFAGSESLQDLRSASEELLKLILAGRLENVQPIFLDEKGFEASWVVGNFLEACYLMLFYDMARKKTTRCCAECGQFFYPASKRPRSCSSDCARKKRQRRYWKRRGKSMRKKRRNQTTKIKGEQA